MNDSVITLSSGLRLCYAEFGDPEGIPVFYFHGWPCSRLHGWAMDETARNQGIRLICPDRPGIGDSEFQQQRQLLDWPAVVEEMAAHLGWERFHIIGVSGGGPYALACALLIPHRLHTCHILCGAPPIEDFGCKDMFWIYRFLIKLRSLSHTGLGVVLQKGADLAALSHEKFPVRSLMSLLPPSDRASLSHPTQYLAIAGSFRHAMTNGADSVIADADIYLNPWRFNLSDIDYPIHFWHGRQDKNISWTYTQKIASRIPQATTSYFQDEGHYSLPANQGAAIFDRMKSTGPHKSAAIHALGNIA